MEDLYRRIRRLGREHGDFLRLEDLGRSVQGRPLMAVRLSDWSISGEHKEHVLLTTLHSGGERIGPSAMLELVDWLLSGHPLARRILARQQVVCVPIVNPDGYVAGSFHNAHDLDPYNNWTLDGPVQPEKHPEASVIQRLMDELQPEVHGDMHGSFLEFYGSIHADTAAAYSNVSLRPYHHEIMRLMNEAALEEGYPADWLEEDSERMFWGPDLDGMREKTWKGRPPGLRRHLLLQPLPLPGDGQRECVGAKRPAPVSPAAPSGERCLARGILSRLPDPGDDGQRPASPDRLRHHGGRPPEEPGGTVEHAASAQLRLRLAGGRGHGSLRLRHLPGGGPPMVGGQHSPGHALPESSAIPG